MSGSLLIRAFYTFIQPLSFTGLHEAFTRLYDYVFPSYQHGYYGYKNLIHVLSPFTATYGDSNSYPYKVSTSPLWGAKWGYLGAYLCLFGITPFMAEIREIFHIM